MSGPFLDRSPARVVQKTQPVAEYLSTVEILMKSHSTPNLPQRSGISSFNRNDGSPIMRFDGLNGLTPFHVRFAAAPSSPSPASVRARRLEQRWQSPDRQGRMHGFDRDQQHVHLTTPPPLLFDGMLPTLPRSQSLWREGRA